MSKAVHWTIPFQSVKGINYEIRIYDDYTGSVPAAWPVTLQAGETPITTQEDASDDFFTPVRPSTGTISVIDPDGTLMEQLIPANNISRPVRLYKKGATAAQDTIEWQGFLSCEAYQQDYTAIAQELQLSIISVLEAMDSIEVDNDESMAFCTMLKHLTFTFKQFEEKVGMSMLNNIYYYARYFETLNTKYIYNNSYFDSKDEINGDNVVIEVHSISAKQIISGIAEAFGCVWRESGDNLFMTEACKPTATEFKYATLSHYINALFNGGTLAVSTLTNSVDADMEDLAYRGTGHTMASAQGAKRVSVEAKLEDFKMDIALRETPTGTLVENPDARQAVWGEIHANTNETFFSHGEHKHMRCTFSVPSGDMRTNPCELQFKAFTDPINYNRTAPWQDNILKTNYEQLIVNHTQYLTSPATLYLTSYRAYWRNVYATIEEGESYPLVDGLMICGCPYVLQAGYYDYYPLTRFALTQTNYLYKQRYPLVFSTHDGKFKFKVSIEAAFTNIGQNRITHQSGQSTISDFADNYPMLTVAIRFGSKWVQKTTVDNVTTYSFTDTFTTVQLFFDHTKSLDIEIPVVGTMYGFVEVMLYHEVHGFQSDLQGTSKQIFDLFITELSLKYEAPEIELTNDRSSNNYSKDTGGNFTEEESKSLAIASDAKNNKQATLIWQDQDHTVTLISLDNEETRPEKDLLSRLAKYYSRVRRKVELEVEHPTAAALPLLTINGYDGKKYLPLAEERDWQQDTSKLTCMETPDGDS